MSALAYKLDDDDKEDDRDLLHVANLSILPIQHRPLQRARMIKNTRLDSVIEVFRDASIGSGQIDVEKLPQEYNWPSNPPHPDFSLLRRVAVMPSYDVYSMRVMVRAHGIEVEDQEALRLSPSKRQELSAYMKKFTRPLMMQVYGEEGAQIETFDDVINLFKDPDMQRAKRRLMQMADKLGIDLMTIPRFLEDYADIFLSLSYYKQCLDRITPGVYDFIDSFSDLRKNYQMRNNTSLMQSCDEMEKTFTHLVSAVTGRIESFDHYTKDMWNDLSTEKFRVIEQIIKSYHTTLGGVLCALTVKMDAWAENFPRRENGGPVKRADFIMTDMKHGMERIRQLDAASPSMSELFAKLKKEKASPSKESN